MNYRIFGAALVIVAVLGVGFFTYFVGFNRGKEQAKSITQKVAVDRLATTLFMLESLEKRKTADVVKILQASTGPQLDTLIELEFLKKNGDEARFSCGLVQKLKIYREQNGLFGSTDWDYLWAIPGMREAEQRRIDFLNTDASVLCRWSDK
jgi:hypothetical protein